MAPYPLLHFFQAKSQADLDAEAERVAAEAELKRQQGINLTNNL